MILSMRGNDGLLMAADRRVIANGWALSQGKIETLGNCCVGCAQGLDWAATILDRVRASGIVTSSMTALQLAESLASEVSKMLKRSPGILERKEEPRFVVAGFNGSEDAAIYELNPGESHELKRQRNFGKTGFIDRAVYYAEILPVATFSEVALSDLSVVAIWILVETAAVSAAVDGPFDMYYIRHGKTPEKIDTSSVVERAVRLRMDLADFYRARLLSPDS